MEARQKRFQKIDHHSLKIMQFLIAFICGLVCLLAVSAAPPTAEQIQHMKEAMKKCIAESGVVPAVLESVGKGEAIDDEKLHCFGACILQDMGIMNEEGKVDPDVAIAHLPDHIVPRDEAIKVIQVCAAEDGGSPCATAGLILKCLHEKKADSYFHM